jgi:hypothetical protein
VRFEIGKSAEKSKTIEKQSAYRKYLLGKLLHKRNTAKLHTRLLKRNSSARMNLAALDWTGWKLS